MKIAMIGSGAAGSVFAAYLRKGGAELWLVDKYKAHMDKIAADGLVFRTPEGEEVLTGFHTSATARDIGTMDMVILMVKATQTEDVMADTMPCIGPETAVVSLQNGLGNDEVLAQFVDADRILYGSGLIGTELAGPGVCVSKPEKGIQMHFGAVRNNPKAYAAGKALEACFRAGGCNASFDEDVRPYIWKKVIANSGYNGVSAVMRLKVKETFADPYGHDIVMHVWKEGCAVAQALGIGDLRVEVVLVQDRDVVDVEPHDGLVDAGAQSAHVDRGGHARPVVRGVEVRDVLREILQGVDVLPLDGAAPDDGRRDGFGTQHESLLDGRHLHVVDHDHRVGRLRGVDARGCSCDCRLRAAGAARMCRSA